MEKVAESLAHHVENFLLTKKLAGCTDKTLEEYRRWLERFTLESQAPDPVAVRSFFGETPGGRAPAHKPA